MVSPLPRAPTPPSVRATFWALLPLHVAVPFGVESLHDRVGFDGTSYAVAGFHVVFPLFYGMIRRWLPGSPFELVALLVLNHAVMGAVGLVLWLWGGR